jgi:septin family protein
LIILYPPPVYRCQRYVAYAVYNLCPTPGVGQNVACSLFFAYTMFTMKDEHYTEIMSAIENLAVSTAKGFEAVHTEMGSMRLEMGSMKQELQTEIRSTRLDLQIQINDIQTDLRSFKKDTQENFDKVHEKIDELHDTVLSHDSRIESLETSHV